MGNYSLRVISPDAVSIRTRHQNQLISNTECEAYVMFNEFSEVIMATYYIHAPTQYQNSVDVFPINKGRIMISTSNRTAYYHTSSGTASKLP